MRDCLFLTPDFLLSIRLGRLSRAESKLVPFVLFVASLFERINVLQRVLLIFLKDRKFAPTVATPTAFDPKELGP